MGIFSRLRRLVSGWFSTSEFPSSNERDADPNAPVWCAVANVVHERPFGPGGAEIRRGTKHFAPGAKVYVVDFFWGMGGEQVTVVGRHRRTKRYITLVMRAAHLANWRTELAYSKYVIRQVSEHYAYGYPHGGEQARSRAEEIVALYISRGATTQPFIERTRDSEADREDETAGS